MIIMEEGKVLMMLEDFKDDNQDLVGRYSQTTRLFFSALFILSFIWLIDIIVTHYWHDFFLWTANFIFVITMFVLYTKPLQVEVSPGRLLIRKKKIDVTRRIKDVKRKSDHVVVIRFNLLYQLDIKGTIEQMDDVMAALNGD